MFRCSHCDADLFSEGFAFELDSDDDGPDDGAAPAALAPAAAAAAAAAGPSSARVLADSEFQLIAEGFSECSAIASSAPPTGRCDSASGKLLNGSSTEQRSKSVNCGSSSPSTKHTRLWSFERKAAT